MRHVIADIPIDAITRDAAAARVAAMLGEQRSHVVVTPNPEMLVDASRDEAFSDALRHADMAIPDGFGLLLVGALLGKRFPERISGTDFVDDVCSAAAAQGKSVFLLGGEGDHVAERAARELERRHPRLRIAGAMSGFRVFWETPSVPVIDGDVLVKVKSAAPDVLLVAFGHRKQELWMRSALPHLPSVRLAMGVGGAFDFIAGDVRRAPALLRAAGLEWLWRLIVQPWRFKRIWKAVVTFPILAFKAGR